MYVKLIRQYHSIHNGFLNTFNVSIRYRPHVFRRLVGPNANEQYVESTISLRLCMLN